jgi:hypothetical protein
VLSGALSTTVPAGGAAHAYQYVAFAEDRKQAAVYASLADLEGL